MLSHTIHTAFIVLGKYKMSNETDYNITEICKTPKKVQKHDLNYLGEAINNHDTDITQRLKVEKIRGDDQSDLIKVTKRKFT